MSTIKKKTYTGVKMQILTPWSTVLFANLRVPLARQDITLFSMEPEWSLSCSKQLQPHPLPPHFFKIHFIIILQSKPKYSTVSFCDGSFYDDSLLRPLSSPTEHSRLVMRHCRNSSVLSLLSALLALFRCACVSSYTILVQFC